MNDILPWLWLPLGYLVGSIPFGLIAGKLNGVDIREHGSGNIGATNALRVLGKPVGYTVLTFDILKGLLPTLLARLLLEGDSLLIPVLTSVATILGHNFPVWLKFKGGKGIATSAGVILPLDPITCLSAVTIWIVSFFVTRIVSIGSLAAALSLPIVHSIQRLVDGEWSRQLPVLIMLIGAWLLATWRHKKNIVGLLNGTENKFEKKAKKDPPRAS